MNRNKINFWLLSYGLCSALAGVVFAAVLLSIPDGVPFYWYLFPLYLVLSGAAISFHHKYSAEFFLGSGLGLLTWAISGIIVRGFGRTELFGLLGSLISVHGYWVLKQELANHRTE